MTSPLRASRIREEDACGPFALAPPPAYDPARTWATFLTDVPFVLAAGIFPLRLKRAVRMPDRAPDWAPNDSVTSGYYLRTTAEQHQDEGWSQLSSALTEGAVSAGSTVTSLKCSSST